MTYTITIPNDVMESIKTYKKSNPIAFKKLYKLMPELEQHPRTSTGHPEPLKGGNDITYSRRTSKSDRLIYNIYDEAVEVQLISVEGHYKDK